jgi:diguanylate cyclase (GGDEF)-like protein/PAS domain S-box-containing protein
MNNSTAIVLLDSVKDSIDNGLGLDVQNILDSFPYYVLIVDQNHFIVAANKAITKDMGLIPEDIIGKYCPKAIHNTNGIFPGCPLEEAVKKGCGVERELFDPSHKRWFLSIIYPIKLKSKTNSKLYLHMSTDITEKKENKILLEENKLKYKRIFNDSPNGIISINKLGIITECNESSYSIMGMNREDFIGKHFAEIGTLFSRDIPKYLKIFNQALKGKKIPPLEIKFKSKDGKISYSECNIKVQKENGKASGFLVVFRDITENKKNRDLVLSSEQHYKSLFENSRDGIYKTTIDGNYIDVNPALVKMLGYDRKEELLCLNVKKHVYEDEKSRPSTDQRDKIFEAELKKKDGTKITVEVNSNIINNNGKPLHYEGIVRNITERKEIEKRIKYLSFHDYLTGLYNRAFFEEELKRLDSVRQIPLSIVIGDVNGLKIINDAFGHEKGDKLLKKIANVLKESFRSEDILARWGGDEFVAILPKTNAKKALSILNRIKTRLTQESTKTMPLNVAFGLTVKESISKKISEVIKEAEDRMYTHKLSKKQSSHSSIISSLEKALEERDYETKEHVVRMKTLAKKLGKKLSLNNEILDELTLLATLHDIGKISIADSIILKPQKLTGKEWEAIKKHPIIGYRIAESSGDLAPIAKGILYHHEWWNGEGYPEGKKGKDIPLISRIISIIDAYDAMVSDRPYRKALSKKEAVEELKRCSGSQFDPVLIEKFLSIVKNRKVNN